MGSMVEANQKLGLYIDRLERELKHSKDAYDRLFSSIETTTVPTLRENQELQAQVKKLRAAIEYVLEWPPNHNYLPVLKKALER